MPLPKALFERLKRRKIIQEAGTSSENLEKHESQTTAEEINNREQDLEESHVIEEALNEEQEEIIAEDYSDDEENDVAKQEEGGKDPNSNREDPEQPPPDEIIRNEDQDSTSRLSDHENRHNSPTPGEHFIQNGVSVLGCPNKYNIYHECSQYCVDNYSKPESLEPTMEQRRGLALILKKYQSNEWTVVWDPGLKTFYWWMIGTPFVSWLPQGMNGIISMSADEIRKAVRETGQMQSTS